jgi:hypothetical protein
MPEPVARSAGELLVVERAGEAIARIILRSISVPGGDPKPAVGRAFVVLPHRERRTPQRLGFLLLQGTTLELLGQVGGDHLEDPTTEHAKGLGVVLCRQRHQVSLGLVALLVGDGELTGARQPLERGNDGAGLRRVDPAGSHSCRDQLVLLEALGPLQVRPGVAAYLPGLDGQPVRRSGGPGIGGGLGVLGRGQQPQLQRLQLRPTLGQAHQHLARVLRRHRHHWHISQ